MGISVHLAQSNVTGSLAVCPFATDVMFGGRIASMSARVVCDLQLGSFPIPFSCRFSHVSVQLFRIIPLHHCGGLCRVAIWLWHRSDAAPTRPLFFVSKLAFTSHSTALVSVRHLHHINLCVPSDRSQKSVSATVSAAQSDPNSILCTLHKTCVYVLSCLNILAIYCRKLRCCTAGNGWLKIN